MTTNNPINNNPGVITVPLQMSGPLSQYVNSIATAGGTTTLTTSSNFNLYFTGTLNQTIVLPSVVSFGQTGLTYNIINASTGTLTIQSNNGSTLVTLPYNSASVLTAAQVVSISTANDTPSSWIYTKSLANNATTGAFYSSNIPVASATNLVSNTAKNVTSISSLPVGIYLMTGSVWIQNTTATFTNASGWISTTSATLPDNSLIAQIYTSSTNVNYAGVTPTLMQVFSSTQTIYLSALATFASGTCTASGTLYAVSLY